MKLFLDGNGELDATTIERMAQSAFAARQAAASRSKVNEVSSRSHEPESKVFHSRETKNSAKEPQRKRRKLADVSTALRQITDVIETTTTNTQSSVTRIQDPVQTTAHSDSKAEPGVVVTAANLTWNETYTVTDVKLDSGNTISVVGEYDLWVRKGSVSILGATIHASSRSYKVFAPSSHAIPFIKALHNPYGPATQTAELTVSSHASGIRRLRGCSRNFLGIWSKDCPGSFAIVSTSNGTCDSKTGQDLGSIGLEIPTDWHLSSALILDSIKPPVVVVCGPKNAGKSTLAKFLGNSLLSKKYGDLGIAYLDLDPGQPEYTAPGNVSLVHLAALSLGPAFSHPIAENTGPRKIILQKHFGSFSPRDNIEHYQKCISDLYGCHQRMSGQCPLIINTCGWIQGLGLELVLFMLEKCHPTHVCYIGTADAEATKALTLNMSIGTTEPKILRVTPQGAQNRIRSSAELRAMQECSYFHLDESENGQNRWQAQPIFSRQTMTLSYAGDDALISGVLLMGDPTNYDMLEMAITMTVLALVVVEDLAKICHVASDLHIPEDDLQAEMDEERDIYDINGTDRPYRLVYNQAGIPYLTSNSSNEILHPPSRSYCLGQVILHRIDTDKKIFHVHTPLSLSTISENVDDRKSLILVRGQLGMSDWVHLEELIQTKTLQEDMKLLKDSGNEQLTIESEFDFAAKVEQTPFVEFQQNSGERSRNKMRKPRYNLA